MAQSSGVESGRYARPVATPASNSSRKHVLSDPSAVGSRSGRSACVNALNGRHITESTVSQCSRSVTLRAVSMKSV
eukprot:7130690-Prymnesium_polylepis.1